jgi:hypothetical protein
MANEHNLKFKSGVETWSMGINQFSDGLFYFFLKIYSKIHCITTIFIFLIKIHINKGTKPSMGLNMPNF